MANSTKKIKDVQLVLQVVKLVRVQINAKPASINIIGLKVMNVQQYAETVRLSDLKNNVMTVIQTVEMDVQQVVKLKMDIDVTLNLQDASK